MGRGIWAAAAIMAATSMWAHLRVHQTISIQRGRPTCARSLFIVLSVLLFAGGEAFADRRVALVIGNASYSHAPALDNPVNDVTAISVMLEGAGFQVVETRSNLDNMEMRRAIRDFSAKTRDADVAVVFYAGHGLEVDGTNYLIPTDAKLASDIDVEDEAISLSSPPCS
jgi:Caspase domain